MLESLPTVAQTEWHPSVLKQAERGDDGGLLYVRHLHRNLIIPLFQIQLTEYLTTTKAGCQIIHLRQQVFVYVAP